MKQTNDANSKLTLLEKFGNNRADRSYFANISKNPLAEAFKKKTVVHAGLGGVPLKKEEIRPLWQSLVQIPRQGKTTVYIHIPFCGSICLPTCGFPVPLVHPKPPSLTLQKCSDPDFIEKLPVDKKTLPA